MRTPGSKIQLHGGVLAADPRPRRDRSFQGATSATAAAAGDGTAAGAAGAGAGDEAEASASDFTAGFDACSESEDIVISCFTRGSAITGGLAGVSVGTGGVAGGLAALGGEGSGCCFFQGAAAAAVGGGGGKGCCVFQGAEEGCSNSGSLSLLACARKSSAANMSSGASSLSAFSAFILVSKAAFCATLAAGVTPLLAPCFD